MTRPLLVLCIGFMLGAYVMTYSRLELPLIGLVLISLWTAYIKYFHKTMNDWIRYLLLICSGCLIGVLWVMSNQSNLVNKMDIIHNHASDGMVGIVTPVIHDPVNGYYSVDLEKVDNLDLNASLMVVTDRYLLPGDRIGFKGQAYEFEPARNPGGFDAKRYYGSKKVLLKIETDEIILHGHESSLLSYFFKIREGHYKGLMSLLGDKDGNTIARMLLGKGDLEVNLKNDLKVAGVLHMMAISGMHIGIICGFVFLLLGSLIKSRSGASLLTLVIVGLYLVYTGMQPSTIRAFFMISMYLIKDLFNKRYDAFTSVFFSMTLMTLYNTGILLDVGFTLSYGAVISLFGLSPFLKKGILSRWLVLPPLAAVSIGMMPLTAFYYYHVSIYSLLANLLIMPLCALLIILGGLALLLSLFSTGLATFLYGSIFFILRYMDGVVSYIADMPSAYWLTGRPDISWFIAFGLALSLLIWHKNIKTFLLRLTIFLMIVVIPIGWKDPLEITMLDVGNGDAMVIERNDYVILVDGGGWSIKNAEIGNFSNTGAKVISPFLDHQGIGSLDLVIVTHGDYDHISGVLEILELIPVEALIIPKEANNLSSPLMQKLIKLAQEKQIVVYEAVFGDKFQMADLTINILNPMEGKTYENTNEGSLVFKLTVQDFSMIFTGDIGATTELRILDEINLGEVDALKVGHHGSKYSTSMPWLKDLRPKLSLISVSERNRYQHPSHEVLKRLEDQGVRTWLTKESGAITLIVKGNEIEVGEYRTKTYTDFRKK